MSGWRDPRYPRLIPSPEIPPPPGPVIIPAGALFTVSTGEYSEYTVWGVFRAKQDIDTAAELAEWLKAHPDQKEDYHFDEKQFFADVTRRGLIEDVPSYEWHLAEYGSSEEMKLTGPKA